MDQKSAYLEAKRREPDLVATETNPLHFIRFCEFNIWDAAQRMVTYWRERKDIFQDRAFRPLSLRPDNSALEPDDILLLYVYNSWALFTRTIVF
mmetsp:Transcript_10827/g.22240  ORF Transcript_10827/g.22240 Transcript_10827/m.22240 type:complete len:94 (-) Transcript_10827:1141-1422(-)